MYRINVEGLCYAPLTNDDATSVTYGTIVAVPGAMSIAMKPLTAAGKLYGDGQLRDETSLLNGIEVDLELNRIPQTVRAAWYGHTATTGAIEEAATATPIFMALGFKLVGSDGKIEYVWLYKGKAAPPEESTGQKTDNITYSTATLKLTFMPRVKDGKLRKWGDENEAGFTGGSTFLSTVPVPS